MATAFAPAANAAPNAFTATGQIVNENNGDCLNGALVTSHAQVTLTPCNNTDNHMTWKMSSPNILSAGTGFKIVDTANGYCLNGYTGTAHAQVTLTRCNNSDSHMWWFSGSALATYATLRNKANSDCLNGYTGTAHAEVTMTPCNSGDHHMDWKYPRP
jgi:hypothetical protein